ncbi:hypothetical protein J8F10_00130 [Gemmata sp. G18]|uniref:G domain-containing protein n=1 Tax=Gemmata palustris TaxID=2822762 RepID=A0ABS5BJ32_9BACT|nr:hypothetical protein [Gemmata palustris]MBP3953708.1 hypothetical protein [Gemmata palustris]
METPDPPPFDVPRVLLFGHRGSGKSALIGALLQAGETQGETLRGEVVSSSVDLPRIREAAYSGKLESANTELSSFTIRLRPWRVGKQALMEPLTVVLDDCDGKAAEALMDHPAPITQRAPGSPLARAVVETDAIVLLVDASSTREELAEAFAEFDAFLTTVERAKTDSRAVGGFPIFLVLTQCDRLAQPGDTQKTWEARVKDRVDYAWKAFEEYLKDADPEDGRESPFLAFGSVELDVSAVAIRRPPLTEHPAPGDQPYQVAELFRDCFSGAKAHHDRVRRSDRRLWWTVRLALTGLTFLLLTLGTIGLFPPETTGPDLAAKIDDYERQERPAADRLADEHIERNKKALNRFAGDSAFARLSEDRRAFVTSRLKEIEDYQAYRTKLAGAIAPAAARSLPELAKVKESLRAELALPAEYSWGETSAAQLRDKWLSDCSALEAAQSAFVDKYRTFDRDGTVLMLKRSFDENWLKDIDALFATAEKPPFPLNAPIPNSPAVTQPRGEAITYRVPYEFDEAYKARRYWEQTRDQIIHLRDLADALGLISAPNRPEAVLVLPEPNGADSAALAATRWAALVRTYTRQTEGFPEWDAQHFPDPARGELVARLRKSFETGTKHVHKLFAVKDTAEGWTALGASLTEPKFREWGKLLHLLARLQDPNAPDPVAELAAFLHNLDKKVFELDLQGFELTVPLDLTFDRVDPNGQFTVTVTHANQATDVAKFTVGKGVMRGTTTVYQLLPDGPTKLTYRAGDSLRAELPIKAGARDLKLLWENGPTNTFQFDRLTREPRLTKTTPGTEPATGVRLTLNAGSVPKFPVLFPLK